MGRLRIATVECNYKETDRQLKKQFIHGLNNSDMIVEIVKELTKMGENENVTSEQVLTWTRTVAVQKAQSAILKHLNETKDFDKTNIRKRVQRQIEIQLQEHLRMPVKQKWGYCGSSHLPRQCLAYGKRCSACGKINHYKEVCRIRRNKKMHNTNPETDQYQKENDTDMVNINSIHINSKHSIITANLKTSSKQAIIVIHYQVAMET